MEIRLRLIAILTFIPTLGWADIFRTSYLEFELPTGWKCEQIETSWACRPTSVKELNRATLVLTAKQASPADHPAALRQNLLKRKSITGKKGLRLTPKAQWDRSVSSNGTEWAEALFFNSEIENYFSYYLTASQDSYTVLLNLNYESSLSQAYQPLLGALRPSVRFIKPTKTEPLADGPKGPVVTPPAAQAPPIAPLAPTAPYSPPRIPYLWWILGGGVALALAWGLTRR